MQEKIVIGSRESRLAVIQSEMVKEWIEGHNPGLSVEILTMKTTGDRILDRTLDKVGGKGLFVKELDQALMDGRSHISVHSLKDMPMEVPRELPLIAYSKREDPRDALVLPEGVQELDPSKPLGTSSLRRAVQLEALFPGMKCKSVRGNVLTRLSKLDRGEYSALILASAGLKRLGLGHRITRYLSPEEMLPSAGQGILAIQGRADLDTGFLAGFQDEDDACRAIAERAFVSWLNGGCSSPVAAHARVEDGLLTLTGMYVDDGARRYLKGTLSGEKEKAAGLGEELARRLKEAVSAGAGESYGEILL